MCKNYCDTLPIEFRKENHGNDHETDANIPIVDILNTIDQNALGGGTYDTLILVPIAYIGDKFDATHLIDLSDILENNDKQQDIDVSHLDDVGRTLSYDEKLDASQSPVNNVASQCTSTSIDAPGVDILVAKFKKRKTLHVSVDPISAQSNYCPTLPVSSLESDKHDFIKEVLEAVTHMKEEHLAVPKAPTQCDTVRP
ncbi:hypothetical protein HAX54_047956, partial [Datura stramonium]|nr:hypothetical protein [Datura stramonium]